MGNFASKTDLNNYAKSNDLSNYVKTSSLNNYVKSSELGNYAKTTDLNFLKAADLTPYAQLKDLTNYVKTSDINSYVTGNTITNLKGNTLWCADGNCITPKMDNVRFNNVATVFNNTGDNKWMIYTPYGSNKLTITKSKDSGDNWDYTKGLQITDQGVIIPSGKLQTPPGSNLCNSDGSICIDVKDIVTRDSSGDIIMGPGKRICNSNKSICYDIADLAPKNHQHWYKTFAAAPGPDSQTWS